MLTDYKIVWQRGNTALIRFYEGSITTVDEFDIDSKSMVPITRYRRSKMIGEKTITTSQDLLTFLNAELKKDKTRTSIFEQR